MNKAYVEIAISLSNKKWGLSSEWNEVILSDAFRHKDRDSIILDMRDWLKIAQGDLSYILFQEEVADDLISNFCDSITEIINRIKRAQAKKIVESDIDQNRLRNFGIASSVIFKNKDWPSFPLQFFENIEYKNELDESCSFEVSFNAYEKERVALSIETNRSINEEELFSDNIKRNVQGNVLRNLIQYPQSNYYKYKSIDSALLDIAELAESVACPVLFVGHQALRSLLNHSLYDKEIADKYNITRRDGFNDEYICHISRCEVYGLRFSDVDYCLFTSKELFETVRFRQISEEQFVEVGFVLNEDSESVGKLKLKYWMDIDLLDDTTCIKLELDVGEEESI